MTNWEHINQIIENFLFLPEDRKRDFLQDLLTEGYIETKRNYGDVIATNELRRLIKKAEK